MGKHHKQNKQHRKIVFAIMTAVLLQSFPYESIVYAKEAGTQSSEGKGNEDGVQSTTAAQKSGTAEGTQGSKDTKSAGKTVHEKAKLAAADLRCGNTQKIVLPQEVPAESQVTYSSADEQVAAVSQGIIIAYAPGQTVITITAEYNGEVWEFEQAVTVRLSSFVLKAYENNSYLIDSPRYLLSTQNMTVAKGKTARMRAVVGKGCITGISFESSDEEIIQVKKEGAYCNITGVAVGKAAVTVIYEIGSKTKEVKMNVTVTEPVIPVSNPVNAKKYKKTAEWEGDYVYFGHYEQDNDLSNGSEMILWRVLQVTDETVLLLSDSYLDSRPYHETFEAVTWKDSDIRAWLNQDFKNRAFTGAEAAVLIKNTVTTKSNPLYGDGTDIVTKDYVYLLSSEEAADPAYGFYPKYDAASVTRKATATEYTKANDGAGNSENCGCWWLRDNGVSLHFGAYVFSNGKITYTYFVGRRNDGVRPVICLDLSKISFTVSRDDYPVIVAD